MQENITPLTVTQLNRQVRSWLEMELGQILVIGELSNLSKPSSGHTYFTLKDATAQLRCVYFRNYHDADTKHFKDGQQVIATGKLSLYEARGDYQLIVHSLSEAGLGQLYRQFEQVKATLQAQGLFDLDRKKPIPSYPMAIGIITSTNGAALHDILTTLERRFPLAQVKVYASEVQGKDAPRQLIKALQKANRDRQVEVLILARGGGSIEDLWAFNDEQLAFAISTSLIPIVSGIGHETDFTIADFVADLRAATPTAAAEAVSPHQLALMNLIISFEKRAFAAIARIMKHKQLLLSHQLAKMSSPAPLIARHWQTLDYLERQLHQVIHHALHQKQITLHLLVTQLNAKHPATLLAQSKDNLHYFQQRLMQCIVSKLAILKEQLTSQLMTLHAVSPLATLDRGYAIATHKQTVLFDSEQVKLGDTIEVQLSKGKLSCEVKTCLRRRKR